MSDDARAAAEAIGRLRSLEARLHTHHYFEAALVARYVENPVTRLIEKEADFGSRLHLALDEAIDALVLYALKGQPADDISREAAKREAARIDPET